MFNRKTKLISMHEKLRQFHNTFIEKLVGNMLDLKRHSDISEENPSFVRANQMGQPVSVQLLIAENKKGIDNTKEYLNNIDELLGLSDDELLERAEELKRFDPPQPPKKYQYKVVKDLEDKKGMIHKANSVMMLTEKEAGEFEKGLLQKIDKKQEIQGK